MLTSPWKIGVFVAMMMMITSFGVGYYITHVYNIDLTWLKGNDARWIIDSFQFFKELYPLAAGVILISLFSYFSIASSVRRYKSYLASGQDYTKMISLADSIDDLTNPAQIAKLSDYPALQNILRNYGDQIKEISSEIAEMGKEERSVDLEMEIDSILSGNEVQETIIEGRWWASLVLKVKEFVAFRNDEIESLKQKIEENRRASGQISLSIGKITEYASGSNKDIIQIVRDLGELNSAANQIAEGGSSGAGVNGQEAGSDPHADTGQVGEALERIAENSRVLESFSEENNGLALNIALMAARGDASEHSLAKFAEKLRETAERFNRLSGESAEAVRVLKANIGSGGNSGSSIPGAALDTEGISRSISEISKNIEKRSHSLQEMIINLDNELELLDNSLHQAEEDNSCDESAPVDERIPEIDEDPAGDSDFVIDHGKIWKGDQEDEEAMAVHDFEAAYLNDDELKVDDPAASEKISIIGNAVDMKAPAEDAEPFSFVSADEAEQDLPSGRIEADSGADDNDIDDKIYDIPENAEVKSSPGPHEGGDWMEMPGNNWKKVDAVADSEEEPAVSEAAVSSGADYTEEKEMDDSADSLGRVTDAILAASGQNLTDQNENISRSAEAGADNEEQVYDLFELGAVEYMGKA